MAEKLNPFFKLLKAKVPIKITSELKETFDSVKKALSDVCELALKQTIPGKQLGKWRTQASEAQAMPSWLKTIQIRKSNQRGRLTRLLRLGQKFSPRTTKNVDLLFTRKVSWQSTWHFSSLHTFCGKQQNRQSFWQITNRSRYFSRQKQIQLYCGMHVITYYNLISK